MAYSSDFIPDHENTMSRDSDWFRTNAVRSRTPVSQERQNGFGRDYPNQPHRLEPTMTDFELLVQQSMLTLKPVLLAAYEPPTTPPHLQPRPQEIVTRIAMHGGPGPGERFMSKRPRAYSPKLNAMPAEPTRVRFERKDKDAPRVHVPSQFHAVAGIAVSRGVSEAADLAALREAARLRAVK